MPAKKKVKAAPAKRKVRRKKVGAKRRPGSMLEVYERRFQETGSDVDWHQVRLERCSAGKHCACRPLQLTDAEIVMICDAVHSVHACGSSIQTIASLQRKFAREVRRIRGTKKEDQDGG